MSSEVGRTSWSAVGLPAGFVFFVLGLALIPYVGIQNDEALFAGPLYRPFFARYGIRILRHGIPLMVFPYTGALKTALYWPVFHILGVNAYYLRVPMLLAGALTIVIFYRFAEEIAGSTVALFAVALLASDATFLLTDTFDFGPVALEHLLLVLGCYFVARGHLQAGCFVFGLALWDKAVFIWALSGLTAGVMTAYYPEVRRTVRNRRVVLQSSLAFLLGALPLIVYNIHRPNDTLKSTAHFSLENLSVKVAQLEYAADGSGLFEFLAADNGSGQPKPLVSRRGRLAGWIRDRLGDRTASLFPYAILLALLAAPLWWRSPHRRPALFALVFSAATSLAIMVTRDAGGGVHHAVLLWPMPHLLVGVALADVRPRWLSWAVGVVLVASNLLVINQYIYQLERNGAEGNFTDAIYPLSEQFRDSERAVIYIVDWGLSEPLNLLHRGQLDLRVSTQPFLNVDSMLADPRGLFAGHVREREAFKGTADNLEAATRAAGYTKQVVQVVSDSNGRPVFEIFRIHR
jgi:4-amino-4-deoxy-L-arabinose transferase-like glycosyltransferase